MYLKIARQVEAEEEFLSNSLLKKLREVHCEKMELENRLSELRHPSSRPSSMTQSRSSSFSVDISCCSGGSETVFTTPLSLPFGLVGPNTAYIGNNNRNDSDDISAAAAGDT